MRAAIALVLTVAAACSGSRPSANGGSGGNANSRGGQSASSGQQSSAQGGFAQAGELSASGGESADRGGATSEASAGTGGADGGDGSAPVVGPKHYPDISFTYDAGTRDADLTPDAACASGTLETRPVPLDLFIMLDRSGSMNLPQSMPVDDKTPGGGDCDVGDTVVSRWCNAVNALDGFFASDVATGSGVALQFFPAGDCATSPSPLLYGCCNSGACCAGGAEASPVVTLSDLPDARPALDAAMNAATPWADRTPIQAALQGLIQYTAKARRPGRQMLGLLITDGGPEGCSSNAKSLATLVSSHLANTGIPTYVIGTQGAAYSWLETIAVAGGAPEHTVHCAGGVRPCHFYDVGSARPDVFIEVLQQIRRAAIACSYALPPADSGLPDLNDVSLAIHPSNGAELDVAKVENQAACGDEGGFYYDDPSAPQTINLCPTSCGALRAADGGTVEILLGCQGS